MTATTSIVQQRELCCLSCGRRPGYVQDGAIHVVDPAYMEAVGRLRCPSCIGGRLMPDRVESVLMLAPLPKDRCGCGNAVVSGESRYCSTCVKRTRSLEQTRERQRAGVTS